MAECNNNCSTCNTSCKSGCPLCNVKGKTVPLITVKSLIKTGSDYLNDNQAYICINRKCNVIYFQEENPKYFIKEEVKVPVWFKSTFNEYIVCYCNNISICNNCIINWYDITITNIRSIYNIYYFRVVCYSFSYHNYLNIIFFYDSLGSLGRFRKCLISFRLRRTQSVSKLRNKVQILIFIEYDFRLQAEEFCLEGGPWRAAVVV